MKVTLWLTRSDVDIAYELWTEEPAWDTEQQVWNLGGEPLFYFCPDDIKALFNINWKGGSRSKCKLTVEKT